MCKKEGYWSTKHTQEERDESRNRYKARFGQQFDRYASQYITAFEGTEDDDEFDQFEAFYLEFEGPEDAHQFLVSTTNCLNNHSINHSLIGVVPREVQSSDIDPFAYAIEEKPSRYNSTKFYSLMIDTGASKASTAGYGQFLAYQSTMDPSVKINIVTAGSINVQFGIGSVPTIGSLMVSTPVGVVEFHIVHADVPFLLSLTDLDALKSYFNNVTNKLVAPNISVPVVRQFGHPFLLWGRGL